ANALDARRQEDALRIAMVLAIGEDNVQTRVEQGRVENVPLRLMRQFVGKLHPRQRLVAAMPELLYAAKLGAIFDAGAAQDLVEAVDSQHIGFMEARPQRCQRRAGLVEAIVRRVDTAG